MTEHKLLYSKRFDGSFWEWHRARGNERLIEGPTSDRKFVSSPQKTRAGEQFKELAIFFSNSFEVDIDIVDYTYYFQVVLHLYAAVYSPSFPKKLAELISLCDRMSTFVSPEEPTDLSLCLEYHTYDVYTSGSTLMNFWW